jgi:hypothetical protein
LTGSAPILLSRYGAKPTVSNQWPEVASDETQEINPVTSLTYLVSAIGNCAPFSAKALAVAPSPIAEFQRFWT